MGTSTLALGFDPAAVVGLSVVATSLPAIARVGYQQRGAIIEQAMEAAQQLEGSVSVEASSISAPSFPGDTHCPQVPEKTGRLVIVQEDRNMRSAR